METEMPGAEMPTEPEPNTPEEDDADETAEAIPDDGEE